MKFRFNKSVLTFLGRKSYLLVIAAWLFTLSFIIDNYWSSISSASVVQREVQGSIIDKERKSAKFLEDTARINSLIEHRYNSSQLSSLVDKKYFIFIYRIQDGHNPSLIFWNTQIIAPDTGVLKSGYGTYFSKLINGWYVVRKVPFSPKSGGHYQIVLLIPVKWNYYVENKYLKNDFVAGTDINKDFDISLKPTRTAIKDIKGRGLFYLTPLRNKAAESETTFSIWLKILAGVVVLFFIHNLARFYYELKGFWPSFWVLIIPVIVLRIASYLLAGPLNLHQMALFNPVIYGSNVILSSLGDLLINSILFLWIVLYVRFHYRFQYADFNYRTPWKKYGVIGIISALMVLLTMVCGNIIRSLVADSQISFDVINFFSLNIYSVIGFIILSCLSTGYFFLVQMLLHPIKAIIQPKASVLYIFVATIGLLFLSIQFQYHHVIFDLYLLIWVLIFLFLLNRGFLALHAYNLVSSRFIFWVFFFSVSITIAIVRENRIKELSERKNFAENLATKDDPTGQVMVNIILSDFSNAALSDVFDRFKNPLDNAFLKDSLIRENFSGYLNMYDTRIYTFDSSEAPLFNSDSTNFHSLNAIIQTQGKPTGIPGLYYYDISYDRFNYISKREIADTSGKTKGYVFIISTPKKFKSDALYPELFSKGNTNSLENSSVYSYAVYNKGRLVSSNNDYPFPTSIDPGSFTYNEFQLKNRNGYEELWYKANGDKIIVIARQSDLFIEAITLFSYLFCSFLVVTLIFNLLNRIVESKSKGFDWNTMFQFTIRNQVHGTIILVSIFSFLVIAFTTILFFISRYHSNNREKLSRTIHVMENEIRNSIDTMASADPQGARLDSVPDQKLEEIITRIAGIHAADINLYDLKGNLKVSSLPLPYKKGIVSEKMDPIAYYHLNQLKEVQYSREQLIGSLEYLSNYVPVRDELGNEYAYLNIPYFESQNNLQAEISNFLLTIINLNAFIFLIAGIIAFVITNRITRSFSLISDKMKDINLEKTNEEILWTRKDEIGALVNEYNKMVKKLGVSAQLLAKSEREGAWREMARQVAHEIKNPLTPMKLNLQYLQMAIDNNSPDVKNISLYVSKILLEQIEHLTQIANDFAQFANIGNSKTQKFDLNSVLRNVASLYSTNHRLEINSHLQEGEVMIHADKTQINRLFTNLLQNAVQSVPETRKAIIEIRSQLMGKIVRVSIKDNGNGIPEDLQSKIFIPNFTTKTSGTGLGLAMCKGIVEKLNGRIWFETRVDQWTVFYVELSAETRENSQEA
ncbi:MAG: GHKL domain-containing protein [Bacteroidota bacterium]|nr:GHKL domain-containing protein [Bacteroidota bacterium]